jgi:uncharacterized protein YjbJ (UPF0337 family)
VNADQLKGKWMRFKDDIRRQWGMLIDDDSQQSEGNYEKVIGTIQERYGGHCAGLVRERYGKEKNELLRWVGWRQHRCQQELTEDKAR